MCLVIFLSRDQPASLGMLQSEFLKNPKMHTKTLPHLKKISFWQYLTAKNVYFCLKKPVLDVQMFIKFDIE